MQCKNCGCEITKNYKICRNCGAEIDWEEIENAQKPNGQMSVEEPVGTFCRKCGAPMRPGAKFCGACGFVQEGKTCPKCGRPISEGSGFCKHCGAKIIGTITKEKKSQKGIIILLVSLLAILLAAGGVLAYVLFNDENSDGTEQGKNPDVTATPGVTATPMPTHSATPRPTEKPKKSLYRVVKSDATWEEAQRAAEREGGHLVIIDSAEEFEKVWKLAQDEELICIWAGAKRDLTKDWADTKWMNGTEMKYTPWYVDTAKNIKEPSNFSEDGEPEQYLTIFKKTKDMWYFNDTVNDISMHYSGKMGYVIETEVEVEE